MSDKIVRNSAFLYLRMFVMLGIAFYTSRILLRELGVDDFGVYNVVGGVVAMFSSLRGAFASSIQRFLNHEMGLNNFYEIKRIFSMSIVIHIVICACFLLLTETAGLWFVNNKLVIDASRSASANWVFHFSILAALVTIMTIPYDALIIAHERMDVFAYISILDAALKLLVVLLLVWFGGDKLKLYAVLVFLVSLITRSVSSIYCRRKFEECRFRFSRDKDLFKKLGSFAGWNFLGNTAYALSNEGANILLNIFGGPSANAARGIAYQVRSAVTTFIGNIQTAANPHSVKLYAQKKAEELFTVIYTTSRVAFFIILIVCLPVFAYTEPLLKVWLGEVPEHSAGFVKLILLFLLVRVFHGPLDTLFKATGKIKAYQIVDSAILLLTIPLSYLLLKTGFALESVFIVMAVVELINLVAILCVAKKTAQLRIAEYLEKVMVRSLFCLIVAGIMVFLICRTFGPTLLPGFVFCILATTATVWIAGLSKAERAYCKSMILRKK